MGGRPIGGRVGHQRSNVLGSHSRVLDPGLTGAGGAPVEEPLADWEREILGG